MNRYVMVNTVWYDGGDSWVAKMILKNVKESEQIKDIVRMGYDGELLKIDTLYELSGEDIQAILVDAHSKESDNLQNSLIADRFISMYL